MFNELLLLRLVEIGQIKPLVLRMRIWINLKYSPKRGPDRSFVTVFFNAFPFCIDLSKSARSEEPPEGLAGLKAGGGLGGPAGGGGPGGGGGGGIFC